MLELTLKQLEVFVCVAETGSFSAAGERLFLSQSTVSSHISAMEAILGVTLLNRGSRRQVCLTPKGRSLYGQCRAIVEGCRALETPKKELALGASTVPMEHILPKLLPAFQSQCPDSRFVLKKGNSAQIHQLLSAGEIDVGLVGTVLDRPHLVYHRLCEDQLILVTPNVPEYRQVRFGRELLHLPLITRTDGSGTQRTVDQYLSSRNIPPVHVVARMDSNEAILRSVSCGLGNAILSELAAREWIRDGRLLGFQLDSTPLTRELFLAYPKGRHQSELLRQFLHFTLGTSESMDWRRSTGLSF